MHKRGQTLAAVIIILGLLIIGAFVFILIKDKSPTGNVIDSIVKNCRDVQVPYQTTESYTDYLSASADYGNNQEKIELFGKGIYQEGAVSLRNTDNEAGWFTVTFNWETLNDRETDKVRHYLEPDESVEFISIFDTSLGEDNKFTYTYKSDPVQKTRTVTKYRTETVCD